MAGKTKTINKTIIITKKIKSTIFEWILMFSKVVIIFKERISINEVIFLKIQISYVLN